MLRRLFLTISLALLFSLGQQGVAVHAISHLADEQRESRQDQKSHHLPFCDQCAAYAALDNITDGGSSHVDILDGISAIWVADASCHLASTTRFYTARAPPRFV